MTDASTCKAVYKICAMCCKGPKQEGLEAELEVDEKSLKVCSACHTAYFCSQECQQAAWKAHKITCTKLKKDGLISCVVMTNPANCKQIFLKPDDPVFETSSPSPSLWLCGIPLCLKQLDVGRNNQWCTYLMIDPVSGMAPYPWSDCGKVLLCRRDRMPLTPQHIYQLGDFISFIIDEFGGDEDHLIHKRSMTKAAFLSFLQDNLPGHGLNNGLGVSW